MAKLIKVLLIILIIIFIVGCNTKSDKSLENIEINIDTEDTGDSFNAINGILHGVTYDEVVDFNSTVNLIEDINPKYWRLSAHSNNVSGFISNGEFDSKITFVIQDLFNIKYGHEIEINEECFYNNCFESFDELRKSWNILINESINSINYINIYYYDIFNEPNRGWGDLSSKQLLILYEDAYNIIKEYDPNANIIGLSYGFYDKNILFEFINFVEDNNLDVRAISWHEFDSPLMAYNNVIEVKDYLSKTSLCDVNCPEIHINEYSSKKHSLIPGWEVGWLYYLSLADVNAMNKACWDMRENIDVWSTCWNGFNGLLTKDNLEKQNIYWVHKFYSESDGDLINVESNNNISILATINNESLKILIGRHALDGKTKNLTLKINFDNSFMTLYKIPNTNNKVSILNNPIKIKSENIISSDNKIIIQDIILSDGDAYFIDLTKI